MTIGTGIFLIAVGAILRYAIHDSLTGVDLATIGLILMIAGAVGLVVGLYAAFVRRDAVIADDVDPDADVVGRRRVVRRARY